MQLTTDRAALQPLEGRLTTIKEAVWLVKQAERIAFGVPLNGRNHAVIDVPRIVALRALRRLKKRLGTKTPVEVADVFGTLVIGKL